MYKQIALSVLLALPMASTSIRSQAAVVDLNKDPLASCRDQIPFGAPVSNDKTKTFSIVCHTGYLSHYDQKAHVPDWVSYTLTQFGLLGCNERKGSFKKDPALAPGFQASNSDYDGSGYDKGHLANAQDMKYDPEIEAESFYFTNMTPQKPSFNRGIWKNLEDMIRSWSAYRDGDNLTVVSGPIYAIGKDKTIGSDQVDVPTGFWKIVIDDEKKEAIAFKFDDQNRVVNSEDLPKQITSIEQIERATNITFPLPSSIDKTKPVKMWDSEQGQYKKEHSEACAKK